MTLRTFLLVLLLGWGLLNAGALPLRSAELTAKHSGEVVAATDQESPWRPVLEALAAKGDIFAQFSEARWFPFRKEPAILTGEIRLSRSQGMSIRYLKPEERLVVVDERGLFLKNAQGRIRTMSTDSKDMAFATVLAPVMRFDLEELDRAFELRPSGDPQAWTLQFTPKDPELVRSIGQIAVTGQQDVVHSVTLRRGERQRIVITILAEKPGVDLSTPEHQSFFRQG